MATASSRLRRAQAAALREEGLTVQDVATLFGVTRQRISNLLRPPGAPPARPSTGSRARARDSVASGS
jgi:predicted transcriptional regulator